MNRFTLMVFAVTAVATVHAETFTYVGPGPVTGTAHVTLSGMPGPSIDLTVYAGENWFKYADEPQTYGYCVDLQAFAGNGTVTKTTTASLNAGSTIGHLLQEWAPKFHATGNKHGAAALQLAIWDLLYDTPAGDKAAPSHTMSLSAGHFKANNVKVNGTAFDPTSYFSDFQAGFDKSGVGLVYLSDSGAIQSFAAVPEPTSIAALAVGAFALLRRRRVSR